MKKRRSLRLQVRLVLSSLGGVLSAALVTPYALPIIEIGNVVVAGILGAVLFLIVAAIAGFIWRHSIMVAPVRWGLAAPVAIAVTIYAGLRLSSGFDPSEAQLAADAGLVGGFCAIFGSAIFLAWAHIAPLDHDRLG